MAEALGPMSVVASFVLPGGAPTASTGRDGRRQTS